MKKAVRLIAMLLMVTALVSAFSVSASALTTAKSVVSPSANTVKIQDVEATYNSLIKKAYETDENMEVIELDEMPDEAEIKYVQSKLGTCIYACLEPDKATHFDTIPDGTKVTVYYRTAGYAFVETDGGLVCWCKSELLTDSFDAKLSKQRRTEHDGSLGLGNGTY